MFCLRSPTRLSIEVSGIHDVEGMNDGQRNLPQRTACNEPKSGSPAVSREDCWDWKTMTQHSNQCIGVLSVCLDHPG